MYQPSNIWFSFVGTAIPKSDSLLPFLHITGSTLLPPDVSKVTVHVSSAISSSLTVIVQLSLSSGFRTEVTVMSAVQIDTAVIKPVLSTVTISVLELSHTTLLSSFVSAGS